MQQNLKTLIDTYATPQNLLIAGGSLVLLLVICGVDIVTLLLIGAAGLFGIHYYEEIRAAMSKAGRNEELP